ncbi:hypothetical protein CSZ94_22415 [Janthinobacterium sp. ROICE36]|nr:hypothetical protein CSZ94_22415 [Janthinobacterium sp. ROICE36]
MVLAPVVIPFDMEVAGYWEAQDPASESYAFYKAPTEFPYDPVKTGRTYKAGSLVSRFFWELTSDGAIKINTVGLACDSRPLNLCAVTGTTIIKAYGPAANAEWRLRSDSNNDGVVDADTTAKYTRKEIELSARPKGEFFLKRSDTFDLTTPGMIEGSTISLVLSELTEPVILSGTFTDGKKHHVSIAAGEATAVAGTRTFSVGGKSLRLPVKMWYDNVQISAAGDGYLLEYEIRRKAQLPADVKAADVDQLEAYERPQLRTEAFGLIDKFIPGPVINAGEKYYSFVLLDFNPDWVSGGGANTIEFSDGNHGTISHHDLIKGKYSEERQFTWSRRADGTLVYDFGFGIEVTARFIKAVNGGYQVLYSIPDPNVGMRYVVHDMVKDAPVAVTEASVPGSYVFTSSDGLTDIHMTLHKDKTVSGSVGGHWFFDTNGDVVSFECTDLNGRELSRYEDCLNSFDHLSTSAFSHIRRLRFMHKDGQNYQVKYDASVYGERFQVVNRDYFTISWTYRWRRIGDELPSVAARSASTFGQAAGARQFNLRNSHEIILAK